MINFFLKILLVSYVVVVIQIALMQSRCFNKFYNLKEFSWSNSQVR